MNTLPARGGRKAKCKCYLHSFKQHVMKTLITLPATGSEKHFVHAICLREENTMINLEMRGFAALPTTCFICLTWVVLAFNAPLEESGSCCTAACRRPSVYHWNSQSVNMTWSNRYYTFELCVHVCVHARSCTCDWWKYSFNYDICRKCHFGWERAE